VVVKIVPACQGIDGKNRDGFNMGHLNPSETVSRCWNQPVPLQKI